MLQRAAEVRRMTLLTAVILALAACVREQDLEAWQGVSVERLDRHPFFITLPVEVRKLDDGTEIRNYVNGANVGDCFNNASATSLGSPSVLVTGSSFCSTRFAACNNIFYIKNGIVQNYVPTASGGAACFTDSRVTPKPF